MYLYTFREKSNMYCDVTI